MDSDWDASVGASGYKLHYGQESGDYSKSVDVGNVTTYTVSDLTAGGWYFVASAYNDYGESDYSNEITKALINESDKKAVEIDIYDINDEDGVVTCRLLDTNRKVIAKKRVYEISNLPCDAITEEERECK